MCRYLSQLLLAPVALITSGLYADQPDVPVNPLCQQAWSCSLSGGVGYRRDHNKAKFGHPITSGQTDVLYTDKDLNSVLLNLHLSLDIFRFTIDLNGDYGWLISGNREVAFPYNDGFPLSFKMAENTGYEADVSGSFGYRLTCYRRGNFALDFIPAVGYAYSTQVSDGKELQRDDSFVNTFGNVATYYQDQALNHKEWFGPYLEAKIAFRFCQGFLLEPFYQYHFLQARYTQKSFEEILAYRTNTSMLGAITQFRWSGAISDHSASGQVGGLNFSYQDADRWLCGVNAFYLKYKTHHAKGCISRHQELLAQFPIIDLHTFRRQSASLSWESIEVTAYAGYRF